MTNTVDHTAEIFSALGITPETQPLLFYRYRSPTMENPEIRKPISLIHTAGHELRADGLAVRLWEIFNQIDVRYEIKYDKAWQVIGWNGTVTNTSFAHAVHDALCEALGIGETQ